MTSVKLGNTQITFANDAPFVLIGGINVLESRDLHLRFLAITNRVRGPGIPLVFKLPMTRPTVRRSILIGART